MDDIERAIKVMRQHKCEEIALYGAEYDLAISALEKQLPHPPEHKVHEKYKSLGKNYYCQCGVMFVDFERNGTNYCGNCGQKLKEDYDG